MGEKSVTSHPEGLPPRDCQGRGIFLQRPRSEGPVGGHPGIRALFLGSSPWPWAQPSIHRASSGCHKNLFPVSCGREYSFGQPGRHRGASSTPAPSPSSNSIGRHRGSPGILSANPRRNQGSHPGGVSLRIRTPGRGTGRSGSHRSATQSASRPRPR